MIFSNTRKLTLSAWLKNNNFSAYHNNLRLQKFLFFYEAFSKVDGDKKADFTHLKGYKNGPVFSTVWGDCTKEEWNFEKKADECFEKYGDSVNQKIAKQCSFIVSTLSESELSELTHAMNIWNCKKEYINQGVSQVPLDEKDFNQDDVHLIEELNNIYPIEMINSSRIINIDNFYFVINQNKFQELTEKHFDVLSTIIKNEELHNPVFIDIDESGQLIID